MKERGEFRIIRGRFFADVGFFGEKSKMLRPGPEIYADFGIGAV